MTLALDTRDLTRTFGLRKALDRLSFTVPEGAFLTVFGPNGAGKSTLLRILTTLDRPTKGTAEVLGLDTREEAGAIRARTGYISHNPMLYADLTAEENLLFSARLYGVPNPKQRVRTLLQGVELDHRRLDVARTFSRGMLQRLSIARALLHDPQLIFLDEPYAGLDPHAVRILNDLLAGIRAGHSFVMVSHDLTKGYELASHILLLERGRKVFFGEKGEIGLEAFRTLYYRTVGEGAA